MIGFLPNVSIEKPSITQAIEFTPDKTDEYFGRVSSSLNYILPETEQVFGNSGYSINEDGLFLGSPDTNSRLLLWDYQAPINKIKKIQFFFYLESPSSLYLNAFTPIHPQTKGPDEFSLFSFSNKFYDAGGRINYIILISGGYYLKNQTNHVCSWDFESKIVEIWETDSNYSENLFLGSFPMAVIYNGFLIPGWSGAFSNQDNKLKKLIIERFV